MKKEGDKLVQPKLCAEDEQGREGLTPPARHEQAAIFGRLDRLAPDLGLLANPLELVLLVVCSRRNNSKIVSKCVHLKNEKN